MSGHSGGQLTNYHTGIDMTPNAAEALSLRSHGERAFQRIPYDDQFLALTCPAINRGGVGMVTPQGVKINYRYFKAPEAYMRGVMHTEVPGRYDPDNSGLAYLFIKGRWVRAYSELYAMFRELSERAVGFMTKAMKVVNRTRNKKVPINAQEIAKFMLSMQGQEVIAKQQKNDVEAQPHRRKILSDACPAKAIVGGSANVIPLRSSTSVFHGSEGAPAPTSAVAIPQRIMPLGEL